MEDYIEERIKEMGNFIGTVSFEKGSDNYNKLRTVLIDTYKEGEKREIKA